MSSSSDFHLSLGGGLELRRLGPADLGPFQAYRSDPEVARYQDWVRMTDEQALGFLTVAAREPLFQTGSWTQIGIARKGVLVGDLGIRVASDHAEIGISLAQSAQGQGVATAALTAMIAHLRDTLGIDRVIAVADARNKPSVRLLRRVGMIHTKTEQAVFQGAPCTELWFEWRALVSSGR